ncbi:putative salicylate hydroxylase [Amylocarpus encephaloides]|uniref:Salicylate hydroxylase n=1 Tax=Amylocarpus encephaloides TaxID=45428 RepID=A0A9P8C5W3_9HELO|nr:putative salicylate hydroxylase [Amylocarpus encephaloides]
MSPSPPPIQIAIIGAGIAGVTLALALTEKNPALQLTIFESRLRFSEISAGVGFGPNAFLDQLVAQLSEKVTVKFGKRVIDVIEDEDNATEKIRMRFEDGEEAYADAVIGCDGIRSACRRILLGENDASAHAVYSGKYAYRKVVDMKKAIKAVGEDVRDRQMFVGPKGHILTHPIRNGKALSVVAFRDAEGVPWKQRQWVIPSTREAILRDFHGWDDKIVKILQLIEDPEKWALFDTLPIRTFNSPSTRFCILGDAAHAATPHLDAGAGFAIEDVHLLSTLLSPDLIHTASDISWALWAWEEARWPRCDELTRRSRNQGRLLALQGDGGAMVTEEEVGKRVEESMRWVWEGDLEGMVGEGRILFCKRREETSYLSVF